MMEIKGDRDSLLNCIYLIVVVCSFFSHEDKGIHLKEYDFFYMIKFRMLFLVYVITLTDEEKILLQISNFIVHDYRYRNNLRHEVLF